MIGGVGWVVQHHSVLALQALLGAIQCLGAEAFFQSDASHGTPALTLDEDLAFLVLVAAYLVAEEIVGTQEPFTVPSMLLHSLVHLIYRLLHALGFYQVIFLGKSGYLSFAAVGCLLGKLLAEGDVILAGNNKQSGNHQALSLAAFALVLGGLEALVRVPGEAVQVQTVVPVGSADEWKLMRTQVVDNMVHRNLQVFEETHLAAWLVVEWYLLGEDGEISRLLDVGYGSENEPARVIVETATDIVVATLGEWLILVIAAAVWELGAGDVDDALAGTGRYLMNETYEVLVGITEAHASADAALEEACGTRHAEGYHALILVPDVHHAVELVVAALHGEDVQQVIPVLVEFSKGCIHLFGGIELVDELMCLLLVDHLLGRELLVLFVFYVSQKEDEVAAFARLQGYLYIM